MINVIGYFNYFFGIARSAEYMHQFLLLSKIPHEIYNIPTQSHSPFPRREGETPIKEWEEYKHHIEGCLNIYIMDLVYLDILYREDTSGVFQKNSNLFYYYCEIYHQETVSTEFLASQFKAILTPSKYIQEYVQKNIHPLSLVLPLIDFQKYTSSLQQEEFLTLLEEKIPPHTINCLYITDRKSCRYRKNIDGFLEIVERMALDNDGKEKYFFILKITHLEDDQELIEKITEIQKTQNNFLLINFYLSDSEMESLYHLCHVYLSLHRAEGYGLTLLDAMMHHLKILCVNYSSPSEFLENYQGWIKIDHKMVSLKEFPLSFYTGGDSEWADPDLEDVVHKLKRIAHFPKSYPRDILKSNQKRFMDFLQYLFLKSFD